MVRYAVLLYYTCAMTKHFLTNVCVHLKLALHHNQLFTNIPWFACVQGFLRRMAVHIVQLDHLSEEYHFVNNQLYFSQN